MGQGMGGGVVTVLMSVFDTPPDLLESAVGSIQSQTWSDFEFLILDDGSRRPETLETLEKAALHDARIRFYREPHRGLTPTLNRGLELARGDLIARQDADDWSEPQRLERQMVFLERHPGIVLVGCAAWTHQHDGTPLWPVRMPETNEQILTAFWKRNPFFHGSVMFRKHAARDAGGYRKELGCSQDYDFFWRLADAGGAANLREPLYHYRYTAGSVSASRAGEQARAHGAARVLAKARRAGEREQVALALQSTQAEPFEALLKQADHVMLAGEYGRAARAYSELLRNRPLSARAWGKLLRLGLFVLAPRARHRSFRWSGNSHE